MKLETIRKGTTQKMIHYGKTVALVSILWLIITGKGANCWAQQTVTAYPGQNLQALVNQNPAGTTFTLTPGIYYYQSITPQSYDSFVGQPGAILSGAALLTNFSQNGAYWMSQVNVTQAGWYPGACGSNPVCTLPEDLFFNNVLKTRVSSLSEVGPGSWYLDYSTGNVYMGDDPTGSTVEISLLPFAFDGAATSVTVQGLIVEKYACVAGVGAINGEDGSTYWSISGNEVRYNHGTGVSTGDGMYINQNYVHSNGELGIGGQGSSLTIQNNEISFNNYAGYSFYNEAGGAKFTSGQDVTFQYNYSHDNLGPGFWTDVNEQNVLCDSNQFTNNQEAAILIELSNSMTISNNSIWNDGFNPEGPGIWWGAAILISDSTNVSVFFNGVSYCMNGIAGLLANRGNQPNGQPYLLQNVNVNSNWITQTTGIAAGIAIEGTGFDSSVYTSWNNKFQYNTFNLADPNGDYFYWLGYPMSMSAFGAIVYAQ